MKPDEENLDFLNWLAESRQDHLSQTGILSSEEYMTEDLTALLGHEPTPDEKADLKSGTKLTTKKSVEAKKLIRKYSKDFNGALADKDCIRLIGCARGSYYKYKREIREEQDE